MNAVTPELPSFSDDLFARWMREHRSFVLRQLRRLRVPDNRLDDAAQDVFLVLLQRGHVVQRGRERAFLAGIALRVALASRRRAARLELREELDDLLEPALDAHALLDRDQTRAAVREAIAGLPASLQALLLEADVEDTSGPALARALGVPVGTVASRLRRARALFGTRTRELLGDALPSRGARRREAVC